MRAVDSIKKRPIKPFFCPPVIYMKAEKKRQSIFRTALVKLAVLVLITGFGISQVSFIQSLGFFSETEISSPNTMVDASLDSSINNNDWRPAELLADFKPGDLVTRNINVVKEGSLDFNYNAQVLIGEEQNGFCGVLQLEARLGDEIKYSGALSGLNFSPPIIIDPTGTDHWIFTLSYPAGSVLIDGAVCKFNFEFSSWQENFAQGQGYSNIEQWPGGEFLSASGQAPAFSEQAELEDENITEELAPSVVEGPAETLTLPENGQIGNELIILPEPPAPEPENNPVSPPAQEEPIISNETNTITPETIVENNEPTAENPATQENSQSEQNLSPEQQPAVEPSPAIETQPIAPVGDSAAPDGGSSALGDSGGCSGSGASPTE